MATYCKTIFIALYCEREKYMDNVKPVKPTLVVMAAGLGSRFGGLKQITSVDKYGHALMDYAIYDAKKAGFGEVVFIIRKDFEEDFKNTVGNRVSKSLPVIYAFQELDMLPQGEEIPEGRIKPWGTTHALYCARDVLRGKNFLTVNSDDYYGYESFKLAADFLTQEDADDSEFGIIGYEVVKTLTENGTVSRGICKVDQDNKLVRIDERKEIKLEDGRGYFTLDGGVTYTLIPLDAVASMNMWAFRPGFINDIEKSFPERFKDGIKDNPLKFEETLSEAVQDIMNRDKGSVKIIASPEKWFGMTYKEDIDEVKEKLAELTVEGVYPRGEW